MHVISSSMAYTNFTDLRWFETLAEIFGVSNTDTRFPQNTQLETHGRQTAPPDSSHVDKVRAIMPTRERRSIL